MSAVCEGRQTSLRTWCHILLIKRNDGLHYNKTQTSDQKHFSSEIFPLLFLWKFATEDEFVSLRWLPRDGLQMFAAGRSPRPCSDPGWVLPANEGERKSARSFLRRSGASCVGVRGCLFDGLLVLEHRWEESNSPDVKCRTNMACYTLPNKTLLSMAVFYCMMTQ